MKSKFLLEILKITFELLEIEIKRNRLQTDDQNSQGQHKKFISGTYLMFFWLFLTYQRLASVLISQRSKP